MSQLRIQSKQLPQTLPSPLSQNPSIEKTTQTHKTKTPQDKMTLSVTASKAPTPAVRFYFVSDNHSRTDTLKVIAQKANLEQPDLIIDGGDFVHDGTESEFKRAYKAREAFDMPVHIVNGNHDAELRGPFQNPLPEIPDFQSFTQKGVHFILLDNEDEHITPEQFEKLEKDLKKHQHLPTVVAMHVPVFLSQESLLVKASKHLPLNFASPVMEDPKEIERFSKLMAQYGVDAVLAGHTHKGDEVVKDGVRYVTSGSSGGLTPGMGIQQEYLDIQAIDGELAIQRVALSQPSKNPFVFLANAHEFYRELNQFNHAEQGWNFTPSVNIEYQAGVQMTQSPRSQGLASRFGVQMERNLDKGSVFAAGAVTAGASEALGHVELGYKHTLAGDYNKGVFASASVGANGGYLHGKASAGVGVKVGVGARYNNWTVELNGEKATNYQSAGVSVGYRF